MSEFTIDYTKNVEELIAEARLDGVDEKINSLRFPIERKDRSVVRLQHFQNQYSQTTDEKDLLAEIEKNRLRPATISELLFFIITGKHPTVQLNLRGNQHPQYQFVALGSPWIGNDGKSIFPTFDINIFSGRQFRLSGFPPRPYNHVTSALHWVHWRNTRYLVSPDL